MNGVDAGRAAGRRRNERLDGAIIEATLALIAERGYQGLALTAVAERAGTTTPAIYRRWGSKAELVMDAVFGTDGFHVTVDTGDLVADVRTMVHWTLEKLGTPTGHAALAGLLGDAAGARDAFSRQLGGVWRMVGERLRHAVVAGELPDLDTTVQVTALAGPAMLSALFHRDAPIDDRRVDDLTQVALRGLGYRRRQPSLDAQHGGG